MWCTRWDEFIKVKEGKQTSIPLSAIPFPEGSSASGLSEAERKTTFKELARRWHPGKRIVLLI